MAKGRIKPEPLVVPPSMRAGHEMLRTVVLLELPDEQMGPLEAACGAGRSDVSGPMFAGTSRGDKEVALRIYPIDAPAKGSVLVDIECRPGEASPYKLYPKSTMRGLLAMLESAASKRLILADTYWHITQGDHPPLQKLFTTPLLDHKDISLEGLDFSVGGGSEPTKIRVTAPDDEQFLFRWTEQRDSMVESLTGAFELGFSPVDPAEEGEVDA